MHGELKDSRFLVIGGSSGIGLAVATAAASAGAAVTIASRSQAKLDLALAGLGRAAKGQQLDTTDYATVESFFAGEAAWDHVAVSAAQTTSGPVRKLSLSDAHATMDSKFWGAYHVARSAKIREHGSLCLVSGFRSVRPSANTVLQGAVNAALEALVRGLALELAPIRVNAVSPGLIATPLWASMAEPNARRCSPAPPSDCHSGALDNRPMLRTRSCSWHPPRFRQARRWWWMVAALSRDKAASGIRFSEAEIGESASRRRSPLKTAVAVALATCKRSYSIIAETTITPFSLLAWGAAAQ
jgi:NAD(P)-dependent dehydrogenase (short-subunit alcohol dehydrogenase family)